MPRRKSSPEVDALSTRQLSPNKCKASILHALKIKRPIFVWGGPGIGKSEVIHQIAKNIDAHVIDIRLSVNEVLITSAAASNIREIERMRSA